MNLTANSYYEAKTFKQTSYMYKILNKFIIVFPLWLLFFAEHIVKYNDTLSAVLKLLVFALMIGNIFMANRYNIKLFSMFILFLSILFINLPMTFNIIAALEELLRFLFAPIFLLYGYIFRKKIDSFIIAIVSIAFMSNIYQIFTYIDYFMGLGLMEARMKDGGYLVNIGLFDTTNAILNLSAFILTMKFNFTKYRNFLLFYFFIFTFLTFSYKTIPFLLLSLFVFIKKQYFIKLFILFSSVFAIVLFYEYLMDMYEVLLTKIDFYILVGNSARFESYRVMFEFLSQFNFLGEGLGSFGGPSSITYNSPIYDKYNFNWFETITLNTTDTYYPHLFVELSWIGGLIFLLMLFLPVIRAKSKEAKSTIMFLLFALLFDALFSFGLNNMLMLSCTVLLFYGLNYKFERLKYAKNSTN